MGGVMRRLSGTVMLVVLLATAVAAQRRGSTEIGGGFNFHSYTDAAQRTIGQLGVEPLVSYYFSRKVGVDLEPGIRFGFYPDSVAVSMLFMGSLRVRLLDMSPSQFRKSDVRRMDLGISSSVFANFGVGVWSEGVTVTNEPAENYSGLAVMAGIGTQSCFGRFSTLRIKLQYVQMLPSGPVYTKQRSMVQIGVGFGIFIRS